MKSIQFVVSLVAVLVVSMVGQVEFTQAKGVIDSRCATPSPPPPSPPSAPSPSCTGCSCPPPPPPPPPCPCPSCSCPPPPECPYQCDCSSCQCPTPPGSPTGGVSPCPTPTPCPSPPLPPIQPPVNPNNCTAPWQFPPITPSCCPKFCPPPQPCPCPDNNCQTTLNLIYQIIFEFGAPEPSYSQITNQVYELIGLLSSCQFKLTGSLETALIDLVLTFLQPLQCPYVPTPFVCAAYYLTTYLTMVLPATTLDSTLSLLYENLGINGDLPYGSCS